MAQLKDTVIFGDLEVLGSVKLNGNLELSNGAIKIENLLGNLNVHGIFNAPVIETDHIVVSATSTAMSQLGPFEVLSSTSSYINNLSGTSFNFTSGTVATILNVKSVTSATGTFSGKTTHGQIATADIAVTGNKTFNITDSATTKSVGVTATQAAANITGDTYVSSRIVTGGNIYEKGNRVYTTDTLKFEFDSSTGVLNIITTL